MNPKLIVIDGKTYNSVDEMPEDIRKQYEQAMSSPMQTTNVAISSGMETARRFKPLPVSPTITPDTSNGWMLALTGLLVVLLCISLAVIGWMAFLR